MPRQGLPGPHDCNGTSLAPAVKQVLEQFWKARTNDVMVWPWHHLNAPSLSQSSDCALLSETLTAGSFLQEKAGPLSGSPSTLVLQHRSVSATPAGFLAGCSNEHTLLCGLCLLSSQLLGCAGIPFTTCSEVFPTDFYGLAVGTGQEQERICSCSAPSEPDSGCSNTSRTPPTPTTAQRLSHGGSVLPDAQLSRPCLSPS